MVWNVLRLIYLLENIDIDIATFGDFWVFGTPTKAKWCFQKLSEIAYDTFFTFLKNLVFELRRYLQPFRRR